ncbi:MAG: GDSL-type esterase/lipase family protein [Verrucomicrobiia bacterium]|tara:strand:+ start:32349 stop:33101 length:753 start_codon:yes stop_codon:yes gene_type:complete
MNLPFRLTPAIFVFCLSTSTALFAENTALIPVGRPEQVWNNKGGETWTGRHEANVIESAQGKAELIFIGDSITHGWDTTGSGTHIWEKTYAPFQAINMGFGGDRIQHVLWRFEHGALVGISPKVAVVMIGTNNWRNNTHEEIAEGVEEICDQIRERLPNTKILLLGIFPRVSVDPWAGANVVMANRLIEKLDDGEWIHYLDIGSSFRDKRGRLIFEIMPDGLHPNEEGYNVWAEAIRPKLSDLMGVEVPR